MTFKPRGRSIDPLLAQRANGQLTDEELIAKLIAHPFHTAGGLKERDWNEIEDDPIPYGDGSELLNALATGDITMEIYRAVADGRASGAKSPVVPPAKAPPKGAPPIS
jgi:hypothetical protein